MRDVLLQEFDLEVPFTRRSLERVYLRLQGIAVPAIYNDSADEKGGIFR